MAEKADTPEDKYKFDIISKVLQAEIKSGHAAKLLGVSTRQIRRLKLAVKTSGIQAFTHGLQGRQSNHHIHDEIKKKALQLIREKYTDFQPTFAAEKLQENHQLTITAQTIRVWMTEEKLWKPRKQKQEGYHAWRPRKEYFGELQQFDGSYHFWLENRYCDAQENPLEICLLASIDDATGKITRATFSAHEGIVPVFTFWKAYVQALGKPQSIYLDKFSTYKINHKSAVDNFELLTQFQRAMQQLTIILIPAHSPQAKGRIERLFKTLQDRLIKELRLVNSTTPEDANRFLQEVFIPKFNNQFAVIPTQEGDVHKPLTRQETKSINHIFSRKEPRRVNNDFTVQFKNHWYQLTEIQPTTIRAKDQVIVEVWLDDSIHIMFKDHELAYMVLPEKPQKTKTMPTILTTHTLNWKPPANHPWRKYSKNVNT